MKVALLNEEQLRKLRATPPAGRNRIAYACRLAGITQANLADGIGLRQQYVSDVACDRFGTITVENARKFAEFFGCTIEDLFPRQGRSVRSKPGAAA